MNEKKKFNIIKSVTTLFVYRVYKSINFYCKIDHDPICIIHIFFRLLARFFFLFDKIRFIIYECLAQVDFFLFKLKEEYLANELNSIEYLNFIIIFCFVHVCTVIYTHKKKHTHTHIKLKCM